MGLEAKHIGKIARNTALGGLALYAGLAPIINHDTTAMVVNSLRGNLPDCSLGVENPDAEYPFSAVAVMGGGMYRNPETNSFELSSSEVRRLKAGSLLIVQGYASRMIILDGKLPENAQSLSSAFVQEQVFELSGHTMRIPPEKIYVDSESINTTTNIQELEKYQKTLDLAKIALVTEAFHGRRSIVQACIHDLHAKLFTVEDVYRSFSPELYRTLPKDSYSVEHATRAAKELLETVELIWDDGSFSTVLKKVKNSTKP